MVAGGNILERFCHMDRTEPELPDDPEALIAKYKHWVIWVTSQLYWHPAVQRLGTFEKVMQISMRGLVQARKVWKANFSEESATGWMCFAHLYLERTILQAVHRASCANKAGEAAEAAN
jgi:hypothetical protein